LESRNNATGNTDPVQTAAALDNSSTQTVTPPEGSNVYGSYKNPARLPSLYESAGGPATIAHPNLRPETPKTWEFGTNLAREGVFDGDDSLRLKVGYFDSTIDDYINRTRVNSTSMRIRNIEQAKFSGVDLSARYERGGFTAELG